MIRKGTSEGSSVGPRRAGFQVVPAIDVLGGRCVRLAGGDFDKVTVEGGDPAAAAGRFGREGAPLLHLVDLDGAVRGRPEPRLVERVVGAAEEVPVQVGGGYRTLGAIADALSAGAARVVIGTAAVSPSFVEEAVRRFEGRVVVAVDVRNGLVAVDGWTRTSFLAPEELARRCYAAGVGRLLVTSTVRDGSLAGPDVPLLERLIEAARLPVVAAGGVASLDDLRRLRDTGCEGAVVGTALWTGRIRLRDALALAGAEAAPATRSRTRP